MKEITLVCPVCHSRITTGDMPGVDMQLLTCPVCNYTGRVSTYNRTTGDYYRPMPDGYADDPHDNGAKTPSQTGPVALLMLGQKSYPLNEGKNVIGRRAASSQADVQIATDDRFMSRVHTMIDVRRTGASLSFRLNPMSPKNPVKINGRQLPQGVSVDLKDGDVLTLGHTELILKTSPDKGSPDPERTILAL